MFYLFTGSLIDVPDEELIRVSINLLKRLNAIDENEILTPLGYHLAKLPVAPQMGKMLLMGAIFGCLEPILHVAASLDFKDAFQLPLGKERQVDKIRMEMSKGEKSDHLILHEAIRNFELSNNKRKYCWDYFLSFNTLNMLLGMKNQFMELLFDLNFVPDKNPKNHICNINSDNLGLIKAVICAGLYPNVMVARYDSYFYKLILVIITFTPFFFRKAGRNRYKLRLLGQNHIVKPHPKSIHNIISYYESPLLVFYHKLKSSCDFFHDATMVNIFPILFFGDPFTYDDALQQLVVNAYTKFKATKQVATMIAKLRERLNWFLEYKAASPGIVDWNDCDGDVQLLW